MPTQTEELQIYLADAERYYQSDGYQTRVATLTEKIRDNIRNASVALDIEGVLTSQRVPLEEGGEKHSFYLRRPFANELLTALTHAGGENRVAIWTALWQKRANKALKTAGIARPFSSLLLVREDTASEMAERNFQRSEGYSDLSPENQRRLLDGRIKVPSLFNFDALLDDSEIHRSVCDQIGQKEDGDKVLPVQPFLVRRLKGHDFFDPRSAEYHYHDEGLLDAAENLVRHLGN